VVYLLTIYYNNVTVKNSDNRSIFGEDMGKKIAAYFFWPTLCIWSSDIVADVLLTSYIDTL